MRNQCFSITWDLGSSLGCCIRVIRNGFISACPNLAGLEARGNSFNCSSEKHGMPIGNTEGNCPDLSFKVIVLHRYFEFSVQMNVFPIANTCFLTIETVCMGACDA